MMILPSLSEEQESSPSAVRTPSFTAQLPAFEEILKPPAEPDSEAAENLTSGNLAGTRITVFPSLEKPALPAA